MQYHDAVLLKEAVEALITDRRGRYADVTFGGGGHSRAILAEIEDGKLIAFDQDEDATANSIDDNRFLLIHGNFSGLKKEVALNEMLPLDGVLADLGVSSHQFDKAERGFSIRFDAMLDMRMDRRSELTATDILNDYSEEELARVFRLYGELNQPRRVAGAIVRARQSERIKTTDQLKKVLMPFMPRGKEQSFLAQVFQALRIEVNDEIAVLTDLLDQAADVLKKGGRLVVISYHSLEDRLVKNLIQTGNTEGKLEKDFYGNKTGLTFKSLTRKPVLPDAEEVARNPRARSAKMRIAERL